MALLVPGSGTRGLVLHQRWYDDVGPRVPHEGRCQHPPTGACTGGRDGNGRLLPERGGSASDGCLAPGGEGLVWLNRAPVPRRSDGVCCHPRRRWARLQGVIPHELRLRVPAGIAGWSRAAVHGVFRAGPTHCPRGGDFHMLVRVRATSPASRAAITVHTGHRQQFYALESRHASRCGTRPPDRRVRYGQSAGGQGSDPPLHARPRPSSRRGVDGQHHARPVPSVRGQHRHHY